VLSKILQLLTLLLGQLYKAMVWCKEFQVIGSVE
jgi:hypothetical protein